MADKNELHMSGTLADTPEVKEGAKGSYCRFRLKVEHDKGKAYFTIVVFGEEAAKLDGLSEGDVIRFKGRLGTSQYEGRWMIDIIATRIGVGTQQGEIPVAEQPKPQESDPDDIPF
jgi:hypothetical protein